PAAPCYGVPAATATKITGCSVALSCRFPSLCSASLERLYFQRHPTCLSQFAFLFRPPSAGLQWSSLDQTHVRVGPNLDLWIRFLSPVVRLPSAATTAKTTRRREPQHRR
ncbi:hypothetical protein EGW08_012800, partial [Elysia chlorotica]